MTKLAASYVTLIDRLAVWCDTQGLKLHREKPLANAAIDALPEAIATACARRPASGRPATPYDPQRFRIPDSYRAFLRLHAGLRVDARTGRKSRALDPLNLFTPAEVAKSRAWVPQGTEIDEGAVTTTAFIAFATGRSPASYWCFYTGGKTKLSELPVYHMDNDHECDLGHFVDGGKWIAKSQSTPDFKRFDLWFAATVDRACELAVAPVETFSARFFGDA